MQYAPAYLVIAAAMAFAPAVLAQAPRATGARPEAPVACDLVSAPDQCGSCQGLTAALQSLPAERLSTGPKAGDVLWTPLYIATRLQCPDAGLALLRRGASPNVGGRGGALVVEIARSAAADALDTNRVSKRARAMDWLHRLGRYALDVDARLPDGTASNRTAWSEAAVADADARAVWSYALRLSATQPVIPEGAQPGNADLPSPDTGVTRPSESAVARGVELFDITYKQTGMSGVIPRLQACWDEHRAPGLTRQQVRWSYEACAGMDLAASGLQAAFQRQFPQTTPLEYLLPHAQEERLKVFRQFAIEGLIPSAHRRALERSANEWLGVIAYADPPPASPPTLAGARFVPSGGPTQAAALTEPAVQPVYPDASRRGGEVGGVALVLRVADDGRVVAVDVDRSSGFGNLDDAARFAALRWRFTPARRAGTPVTSYVRAVASFALPAGSAPRATLRTVGG